TLIRVRFDREAVLAEYAALMWASVLVRRQIESMARTTAGIYKINQRDLEQIEFPVPSIQDQRRVLTRAEEQRSASDSIARVVAVEEARARRLRAAILDAAFSGTLVPQHPNDEPASVLLDRIAAERTSRGETP